jgi:rubrerythrin
MAWQLPPHAPKSTGEAFAYVNTLKNGATVDDLKIMALVEAMGQQLYEDLATGTDHIEIKRLLKQNGREELGHAHRLVKVIKILTGEDFPLPPIEQNPVYTPAQRTELTRAALLHIADAEFDGENLYEGIAASFDNAEAKALLRQSGKEEIQHGHRVRQAAELLPA